MNHRRPLLIALATAALALTAAWLRFMLASRFEA